MSDTGARDVVLGAGPCGLAAAWSLCRDPASRVVVAEKAGMAGGLSGTFERGPFRLDFGPHKFYTRYRRVQDLAASLVGEDLLAVPKASGLWLRGRRLNYPLTAADMLLGLGPGLAFRLGLSYARALAASARGLGPERTYEDWVVRRFGRAAYELVFEPMASKVWGPPSGLDADLARVRIAAPGLLDVILRTLAGDRGQDEISAKVFYYPRRGFGQLWEALAARVAAHGGTVELHTRPVAVRHDGKAVREVRLKGPRGESAVRVRNLVSTIPIRDLLGLLDPPAPAGVERAASGLSYRASILAYAVVGKPRVLGRDAWMFFPEKEFVFTRVAEQKAMSPELVPAGVTVVNADIPCAEGDAFWAAPDSGVEGLVSSGLARARLLAPGEITEFFTVRVPRVYPVYDLGLKERLGEVFGFLESLENFLSVGRHGYFLHDNADNAVDMGLAAGEHLLERRGRAAWQEQKARFAAFKIVD